MQSKLHNLCSEYKDIFSENVRPQPARKIEPLVLSIDSAAWNVKANRAPARPVSLVRQEEIRTQVNKMLAANVIQPSEAPAWSQVLLVTKTDGTWRFCIDFRALNRILNMPGWPIPNIRMLLRRIGDQRPKRFCVIDMTTGYITKWRSQWRV